MSKYGSGYKRAKTHGPQPAKHRPQRGAEKIGPGMYIKDGQVDVYIQELLEHFDLPDTEENRDAMAIAAQETFGEVFKIPETERHVTHGHQCPTHKTIWFHEGLGCGLPRITPCGACLS